MVFEIHSYESNSPYFHIQKFLAFKTKQIVVFDQNHMKIFESSDVFQKDQNGGNYIESIDKDQLAITMEVIIF